jgi:hypothetical protein
LQEENFAGLTRACPLNAKIAGQKIPPFQVKEAIESWRDDAGIKKPIVEHSASHQHALQSLTVRCQMFLSPKNNRSRSDPLIAFVTAGGLLSVRRVARKQYLTYA